MPLNFNQIFDEFIAPFGEYNNFCSVPDKTYATEVSGYVHYLRGNALLIDSNLELHVITADYVEFYQLNTGDQITALVNYSDRYERSVVVEIKTVQHVDCDQAPAVPASRSFTVATKPVKFGHTVLIKTTTPASGTDKVTAILQAIPHGVQKVVLSFAGRPENYEPNDLLFNTQPTDNTRTKLLHCLQAFFRAKELAKTGADVVIVIDNLDKMFTVFNSCMQRLEAYNPEIISPLACQDFELFMRSSKCLATQGTLTIIGLHCPGDSVPQQFISAQIQQMADEII